jgi:carbon monoxide dehydrogenase subunit G
MHHLRLTFTIDAEQEKVFALISDHERFIRGPDVKCRIVTPGREDRNGVGAVREVTSAGSVFTEEVTSFDPPSEYSYVVRTLLGPTGRPTPFTHQGASIRLSREGGKTRIDWQSRFGIPIPVIGWLIERAAGTKIRGAIAHFLASAKTELERGSQKR